MKVHSDNGTAARTLLDAYRRLESLAARMVERAREQDWETLIGEEREYVSSVAALSDLEEHVTLDEDQRRRKAELLERILDHDLEIRSRLLERREELTRLMAVSRREKALNRSYGGLEKERP